MNFEIQKHFRLDINQIWWIIKLTIMMVTNSMHMYYINYTYFDRIIIDANINFVKRNECHEKIPYVINIHYVIKDFVILWMAEIRLVIHAMMIIYLWIAVVHVVVFIERAEQLPTMKKKKWKMIINWKVIFVLIRPLSPWMISSIQYPFVRCKWEMGTR